MSKTRQEKQALTDELVDKLRRMKSVVFTSISGYTMKDADILRSKGRKEGVEFIVTKKTLLARALEAAGVAVPVEHLEGSVLTSIGFQDEVAPAKLLAAFGKDREGIKILSGILEGKSLDATMVKTLAKLPGKQELLAKLVGSLNAPVSGFVNVLAGNLRGLVNVLNAIKETKVSAFLKPRA